MRESRPFESPLFHEMERGFRGEDDSKTTNYQGET